MLHKHKSFVIGDKDVGSLQKSSPSLVEVYACQLLGKRSDLIGENQRKAPAHV